VVLINVVQNPDGRVGNHRTNANGFDLNRDFIAQTQPEVRATVRRSSSGIPRCSATCTLLQPMP